MIFWAYLIAMVLLYGLAAVIAYKFLKILAADARKKEAKRIRELEVSCKCEHPCNELCQSFYEEDNRIPSGEVYNYNPNKQ